MRIHIPGTPCAKQRARVTRNGSFTPEKTVAYEQHVRNCVLEQVQRDLPVYAKGVPIRLETAFVLLRPDGVRRGKKRRELPTVKPDLDNYMKSVQDALNGYLYHDDSQIVNIFSQKFYTEDVRNVGAVVNVERVNS